MPDAEILWTPSDQRVLDANITRYRRWLVETRGQDLATYQDLWRWSVPDLEGFWRSVAEFFSLGFGPGDVVVRGNAGMFGTRWFPSVHLNYAEHALAGPSDRLAVIAINENGEIQTRSWAELRTQTAAVASGLRRLGVGFGDRVAAYLPNSIEALEAMLATASIGAIWSSCAPEFGASAVVDRFRQIEPTVLFAVARYRYNGREHDRRGSLEDIQRQMPFLRATVLVGETDNTGREGTHHISVTATWNDLLAEESRLEFEQVPFEHPLWVLYSSGTTGLPKAIVHSHGGITLEQVKSLSLHFDLGPGDRFFWYSTTGWMMWNSLVSGLLVGATVVLYDGSPTHPDIGALWRMAERMGVSFFGTSAPFLSACMKAAIEPGRDSNMSGIRTIGSTASPLTPDGFRWTYAHVGSDLLLASTSGGTDVCTSLVTSCPILPVRAGEIQCRALGVRVEAFDERGQSQIDEVGELVVTEPMPSMPVRFWNDPDERRLRESYFDRFPGVWTHGDWIKITRDGGCIVSGRSDATLNRGGVRMGTSEFYRVVEAIPWVEDSLVVDVERGSERHILLFIVLAGDADLNHVMKETIARAIREDLSPRHVPDEVYAIKEIPRTLNGKKLEIPVRRIIEGSAIQDAVSLDSVANQEALVPFLDLARADGRDGPFGSDPRWAR